MIFEEVFLLLCLGIMFTTIVVFLCFSRGYRKRFLKNFLVCLSISLLFIFLLACHAYYVFEERSFFEFPSSQLEWQDRIADFSGIFFVAAFVSAFVSVFWTLQIDSKEK